MSVYVEYHNRSDSNNNMSEQNHQKFVPKLSEQPTGTHEIEALLKTAILALRT